MTFLKSGDEEISFSDYYRKYIHSIQDAGQVRNVRNYEMAITHFEKYIWSNRINFSVLTTYVIERCIKFIASAKRAKKNILYASRQVFKAALLEYNDYDR
ncbi:MAG: phage integrase SAM-like domain-containing protein [Muribaculaceae bacterium]|nr:phage integrase SAM-like domain-containing protein [Muribaculaceae bacterium]